MLTKSPFGRFRPHQHCMYLLSRFLSLFCSFGACCSKVVLKLIGPVLSFLAVSLILACTYVYFTINVYFLTDPIHFNLSANQSYAVTFLGVYLLVKTLFHYFATMLLDPGMPPPSHTWTQERRMLLALDPEISGSQNVLTGDEAVHREMWIAEKKRNQSINQSVNQSTSQSNHKSEHDSSDQPSETTVLIDHSHAESTNHSNDQSTNQSNNQSPNSIDQSNKQSNQQSDSINESISQESTAQSINQSINQSVDMYRYCYDCECIKPPRTHHCSLCHRCVLKMDHHCPWVNNCVGHRNFKHFVLFTLYLFFVCLFFLLSGKPNVLRVFIGRRTSVLVMLTSIIALSGSIASCIFITWNLFLYSRNQTTIEFYSSFLSNNQSNNQSINQSTRPYDLGFRHNITQVFGPNVLVTFFLPLHTGSMGDGCVFPMNQGRGWPMTQLSGEKSDV